MLVDSIDREQMDDAKLARIHPEALEAKMKARAEFNPVGSLIDFLKKFFPKKAE